MLPYGRKTPLPFPFSQRSHVGNLRQTLQGKGVIHKRVETAGVYPLVRPRGVSARSRAPQSATLRLIQAKNPRPLGANPLTQFVSPAESVQRKNAEENPLRFALK